MTSGNAGNANVGHGNIGSFNVFSGNRGSNISGGAWVATTSARQPGQPGQFGNAGDFNLGFASLRQQATSGFTPAPAAQQHRYRAVRPQSAEFGSWNSSTANRPVQLGLQHRLFNSNWKHRRGNSGIGNTGIGNPGVGSAPA